jgi:glycosyltransferase involved in cell wall biosynthesis
MISVCMATYNGERYIKDQLLSILSQLGKDDEIIISDDLSTDSTIKIIKGLKDNRIILLRNRKFRSPIFNFENSLRHSKGDIIFLSDQDDLWRKNKVKLVMKYMNKYDLILTDADIINNDGVIIGQSFFKKNRSKVGLVKNIIKNSYLGCSMAFNRNILDIALPFPKDIPMHDWWIGLIGELYGNTYHIEKKLISYRRHNKNASSAYEKSNYSLTRKLIFRILIIKNLLYVKFNRLLRSNLI